MNAAEGVQAFRAARSGGGARKGRRRQSVSCCSLDLFCYECRRRKR